MHLVNGVPQAAGHEAARLLLTTNTTLRKYIEDDERLPPPPRFGPRNWAYYPPDYIANAVKILNLDINTVLRRLEGMDSPQYREILQELLAK